MTAIRPAPLPGPNLTLRAAAAKAAAATADDKNATHADERTGGTRGAGGRAAKAGPGPRGAADVPAGGDAVLERASDQVRTAARRPRAGHADVGRLR